MVAQGSVRISKIVVISAFFALLYAFQEIIAVPCSPRLLELAEDAVYTPWRDTYKKKEATKTHSCADCQQKSCVFCALPREEGHNFILARHQHCFVLMNIYPYTKGHLLVIPYHHTATLADLSQEARLEIMNVITYAVEILRSALACEGFNIGVNMGEAAKASVPDHLHFHIMPRYKVDAGFAHLIGGTKVVAWDLLELYEELVPLFESIF